MNARKTPETKAAELRDRADRVEAASLLTLAARAVRENDLERAAEYMDKAQALIRKEG